MAPWSKYCADAFGFWIETPEAYAHSYERIKRIDGVITSIWRHDNDGLMGKIAIARRLAQCLLPVRELHLKRATGGLRNCGKRVDSREGLFGKPRPSDCQQICNAVAVNRDLLHEREAHFFGMSVNLCFLHKICSRKSLSKTIFRRSLAAIHRRKIVPGLMDEKFWNGNGAITHG